MCLMKVTGVNLPSPRLMVEQKRDQNEQGETQRRTGGNGSDGYKVGNGEHDIVA